MRPGPGRPACAGATTAPPRLRPDRSTEPEAEHAALVDLLGGLCEFAGKGPDALVTECLRTTKSGDRAISAKGRRWAEDTIEAFVATKGFTGHQAVVTANALRGFLIHNGIFMQGPASIG
ncbi:MAG TPA: hypothetical protein VIH95_05930 [Acidimicrobiales bacterium]|jgi:hypothetical protein